MKALQICGKGCAEVIDLPMPEVAPGEVLLKVEYVSFCGSDLNTFKGLNGLAKMPVIPGHEIGAVIEAVGKDVPSFLKPGMRATVNPYTNCGHCPACDNRRFNACEHNETLGVQRDGAMRQYIALPWEKIIPDQELSTKHLAMVEPMSVGFHAVDRGQVTDCDTVMVTGCGMIGVGAIVRAAMRGARVIAVDVDDEKLALAKRLGATETVNSMTEDLHSRIQEITAGRGVDVAIEAVGRPETYNSSIQEVGFTGRVVCIGYSKSPVTFDTSLFVKKELDIRGSRNANPTDFKAVINYLHRGICPIDELITSVHEPEEAQAVLEAWEKNPGRVFRILIRF